MAAAQAGDFVTADAGLVGGRVPVEIAVGPMWGERRHASCSAPEGTGNHDNDEGDEQ
jgi:hypothetical protein